MKKNISTWQLALMTAAAVISLRGLPMMAQEELTMFFYIFFATFLFLIPAALVAAELGSAFADRGGGVYTWVKEAFNRKMGFTAIFLQWIQNVVWYPTVLGFAAASIAYMIGKPDLSQNGWFVGVFSIAMYWLATWLTFKGTSIISRITSQGFLLGTVLPGVVIIVMAIIWIAGGNPIAFEHVPDTVTQVVNVNAGHVHPRFFPHMTGISDIAFLAGILLLFAGVEVHAVHVREMKEPQKQFPAAMFLAALISFALFTLGSLAVAIVTPYDQINLQAGLFVSFQQLFSHYHIGWLTNVMGLLAAFGALAGVMSWISGPSRGLLWTANDGQLAVFLLSSLTIGLYLVMYMMMYASGIKLRYTQPDLKRSYKVPGGKMGMWLIAGVGFLAVAFSFIVTFFPPSQLPVGSPAFYTGLVIVGTVVFVGIPILISTVMARRNRKGQ